MSYLNLIPSFIPLSLFFFLPLLFHISSHSPCLLTALLFPPFVWSIFLSSPSTDSLFSVSVPLFLTSLLSVLPYLPDSPSFLCSSFHPSLFSLSPFLSSLSSIYPEFFPIPPLLPFFFSYLFFFRQVLSYPSLLSAFLLPFLSLFPPIRSCPSDPLFLFFLP